MASKVLEEEYDTALERGVETRITHKSTPKSTITRYDEHYEPSEEEVLDYAAFLGMTDPGAERELLWIARDSLKAPLPANWKPCQTDGEEIYYFNFSTGESLWDHPCDQHYRDLYAREREEWSRAKAAALAPLLASSSTGNACAPSAHQAVWGNFAHIQYQVDTTS